MLAIREWWDGKTIEFRFLIVLIFGIFIFGFGPPTLKQCICEPEQPIAWKIETHENSKNDEKKTDSRYGLLARKGINTEQGYKEVKAESYKWSDPLCSELKFTDLLLSFFTYALVVATWYLMKNTDETAKRTERAYVFCGGLYGVPKTIPQPEEEKFRQVAGNFRSSWRIVIHNYGKTPGFIKKIEWGVCPRIAFEEHMAERVSKIIEDRLLKNWMREVVNIHEIFAPTGNKGIHYRHIPYGERINGEVFFGRITYDDVFKVSHYSTFAILHGEDHSDTIGESFSKDWN